jgi:deazaflavin-dependent oxidoreductase (nitroreductase family)
MPLLGRRVARFNKVVTNRIQEPVARYVPPYAVVIHKGRQSGRTYRTPVVAIVGREHMTIPLPYGEDSDWVRNLLAAGGGELVRAGRTLRIEQPRVVDARDSKDPRIRARPVSVLLRRVLVADVSPNR